MTDAARRPRHVARLAERRRDSSAAGVDGGGREATSVAVQTCVCLGGSVCSGGGVCSASCVAASPASEAVADGTDDSSIEVSNACRSRRGLCVQVSETAWERRVCRKQH